MEDKDETFSLEGQMLNLDWKYLGGFGTEEAARKDLLDWEEWARNRSISKAYIDFRIIKVTTIREIL